MFSAVWAHVDLVRVFFVGQAHSQALAIMHEERFIINFVPRVVLVHVHKVSIIHVVKRLSNVLIVKDHEGLQIFLAF